jgi:RNA polymerase sigma-70 factor (ECF subfamily)
MQIARNSVIDFFRKGKQQKEALDKLMLAPLQEEENTWNEFQENLANYIPEAIQLLPEKYREAVYLTEIEGLSQKELAQRLGISYSGAKSRVQRGKQKLKEVILECCLVETDSYGNILKYGPRPEKTKPCETDCSPGK